MVHPVESRKAVPLLPPVMSKVVDADPLTSLQFEEDCIITSCSRSHICTWDRPKEGQNDSQATLSVSGSNT